MNKTKCSLIIDMFIVFTTYFDITSFSELYYWPDTNIYGHYDIRSTVTIFPYHIHVFPEDCLIRPRKTMKIQS